MYTMCIIKYFGVLNYVNFDYKEIGNLFVIYLQMTEVILLYVTCVYATNNMGSFANNSHDVGCIYSTRVYGYWLSTYK